jgi:hypothetical protein
VVVRIDVISYKRKDSMKRMTRITAWAVAALLALTFTLAGRTANATCITMQRGSVDDSITYDTSVVACTNEGDDSDDTNDNTLQEHEGNGCGGSAGQWWSAFAFDTPTGISLPLTSVTFRTTWYRGPTSTYVTQADSSDVRKLFPILGPWDNNSTSTRAQWAENATYDLLVSTVGIDTSTLAGSGRVDSAAGTVIYTDSAGPKLWQITYDVTAWAQGTTWGGGSNADYGLAGNIYDSSGNPSLHRADYMTDEWTQPNLNLLYPGSGNLSPAGYQPTKADVRELWTFCW